MPATWRDTRNESERWRRIASAWRQMARVEAAIARDLTKDEAVSGKTLLRSEMARSRLRILGESMEGL